MVHKNMGIMLMSAKTQILLVSEFQSKFDLLAGKSANIRKCHIKKNALKPCLYLC